jgi:hypothetical protein
MPPKKNARYDRMIEIIHKTTPSICCWQKSFRRASGEMQRLECWRVKNRLIILQTWGETGFQLFSDDTPATFDEIAAWLASDSPAPVLLAKVDAERAERSARQEALDGRNVHWTEIPNYCRITETKTLFIAHLPDGDAVVYWSNHDAKRAQKHLRTLAQI